MATTFVIYQALTQDFVPRSELLSAVALNGVAINLARAIGPALAGLIIAALSAGALFAVEAGLLVAIVALVAFGVRPPGPARASGERFAPAVRAGHPVRPLLAAGAHRAAARRGVLGVRERALGAAAGRRARPARAVGQQLRAADGMRGRRRDPGRDDAPAGAPALRVRPHDRAGEPRARRRPPRPRLRAVGGAGGVHPRAHGGLLAHGAVLAEHFGAAGRPGLGPGAHAGGVPARHAGRAGARQPRLGPRDRCRLASRPRSRSRRPAWPRGLCWRAAGRSPRPRAAT